MGWARRRRQGLLDRRVTRLLDRVTRPKSPDDDCMRDDIVDAAIGFRADELDAHAMGNRHDEGETNPDCGGLPYR